LEWGLYRKPLTRHGVDGGFGGEGGITRPGGLTPPGPPPYGDVLRGSAACRTDRLTIEGSNPPITIHLIRGRWAPY